MRLFHPDRDAGSRAGWTPQRLAVAGALWTTLVANWPLWRALWRLEDFSPGSRVLLTLLLAAAIAGLTVVLLSPLAWRRSIRAALLLLFLSAAPIAHFIGSYGVVVNPTMMRNVLQTDAREVRDLIGVGLVASVLLLGVLPAALMWRVPIAYQGFGRGLVRNLGLAAGGLLVCVGAVFADFADMASLMRGKPELRYMITPLNGFYSLATQVAGPSARQPALPAARVATDARVTPLTPGQRPRLLLMMLGETARADRLSINGYVRKTTPELERLGAVSFTRVTACGTDTAQSLPCMFSLLDREEHAALKQPQEDVLDVLHHAGFAVLWVDNQSGCKSLCDRIPSAFAHTPSPGAPPLPEGLCRGHECLDEALLHALDARIAALDPARVARGVVIVAHQMGSHGPAYWLRSPPSRKPFLPECTSVSLRSCEKTALDNAYDNSIAYTDHVLARSIDWLNAQTRRFDPALLYVSDHGESLGEGGMYLHGMPYKLAPREQVHVPLVVWWPEATALASGVSLACLRERRDMPLTHSHLSHTVMAWMGVQTASLRPAFDAFAPCRQGS